LVKEDKKAYFMCQFSVFYGEYENEKKKGQNNLTFQGGFEPRIFEQVPAYNLNFEGD
jgi:hypothetical protein